MSIVNPLNVHKWDLGNMEVGKYVTASSGSSSGTLKLYIPKLMPFISMGMAKASPIGISKSCFANADTIAVATTLQSQNFLSVPPQDNRSFKLPRLSFGGRVFVEIRNKNPDTRYVSTKEDNSHL